MDVIPSSSSQKLKKSKSDSTIAKSMSDPTKKENFFDAKDKKSYRDDVEGAYYPNTYRSRRKYKIGHNFTEDSAMSDEEACYQDDPDGYLSDEYRPTEKELREVSTDSGLSDLDESNTEIKGLCVEFLLNQCHS